VSSTIIRGDGHEASNIAVRLRGDGVERTLAVCLQSMLKRGMNRCRPAAQWECGCRLVTEHSSREKSASHYWEPNARNAQEPRAHRSDA